MTIFLSDCHLGYTSNAQKLLNFLRECPKDQSLVLVGDIFERSPHHHNASHFEKYCFYEMKQFKDVTYIPGNHDPKPNKLFHITDIDVFKIVDSIIYVTASGRKYYVCHGDKFDWLIQLTHFASESWFAKRFRSFFSLFHNYFCRRHSKYEARLIEAAKWRDCVGVICGHSHDPAIEEVDGIEYINCGDWIDDCTFVVEENDEFKLLYY